MKRLVLTLIIFLTGVLAMAENNSSVAFVLRVQDAAIDLVKLRKSMEESLSIQIPVALTEEKGTILVELHGDRFLISRMPVGVPKNEIKAALANSLLIKSKAGIEESQKAHLIVSAISKTKTRIENRLLLTSLVSAVLRTTDSLGVYWGSAAQVIQPNIFLSFAGDISSENLPIPLWVSFTVGKGTKAETNLFSTGMKDLGYPEYEVIDLKMKWEDCYYFLLDFTNYMVSTGDKIADGDSIGRDENEKLKVKYIKSELTDDTNVMRVYM